MQQQPSCAPLPATTSALEHADKLEPVLNPVYPKGMRKRSAARTASALAHTLSSHQMWRRFSPTRELSAAFCLRPNCQMVGPFRMLRMKRSVVGRAPLTRGRARAMASRLFAPPAPAEPARVPSRLSRAVRPLIPHASRALNSVSVETRYASLTQLRVTVHGERCFCIIIDIVPARKLRSSAPWDGETSLA